MLRIKTKYIIHLLFFLAFSQVSFAKGSKQRIRGVFNVLAVRDLKRKNYQEIIFNKGKTQIRLETLKGSSANLNPGRKIEVYFPHIKEVAKNKFIAKQALVYFESSQSKIPVWIYSDFNLKGVKFSDMASPQVGLIF